MDTSDTIGSLMFFTLIAVALIAVVMLGVFLQRRSNRHSMADQPERNAAEIEAHVMPERDRNHR